MLFAYEQKIICSHTQLNDIAHEQTIICRQLSAGHVVSFRPMKRKKNLHENDNSSYYKFKDLAGQYGDCRFGRP